MFAKYTLQNANGLEVTLSELGAAWTSCRIPLQNGEVREVLLAGKNIITTLREGSSYAGAIVGRYAGRIAQAKYGEVILTANQPPHCLHGGKLGFSYCAWDALAEKNRVIFGLDSLAWSEGFPGNMHVEVLYQLNDDNQLSIDFRAECDMDTACNLTNHAYFNLNGGDGNDGLEQKLQIFADKFQPVLADGMPDGDFLSVVDSSFDFRQAKMISADFLTDDWQKRVGGYDHSFILPSTGECQLAAVLQSKDEKIAMTVATTQPAIHLYTGQFLGGMENRAGGHYENCAGIALETQAPPDSPNLHPEWGILKAGKMYQQKTIYDFTIN